MTNQAEYKYDEQIKFTPNCKDTKIQVVYGVTSNKKTLTVI